ncbi:MAG: hypothetical protein GX764_08560, partial [Firmicutes bacterium]|nr:hypothetical protein [Bacillota bacterium]
MNKKSLKKILKSARSFLYPAWFKAASAYWSARWPVRLLSLPPVRGHRQATPPDLL